nr:GNAT family N-acetyltransferase [Pseudoalteromonas sp. OOF1S-7]
MISIIPLDTSHYPAVIELGNLVHGENYLDLDGIKMMHKLGTQHGLNASFVAIDESNQVVGFRTSYSAGQWPVDKWCSPALWPVDEQHMAYFKCIAVHPDAQGQSIGPRLLKASVAVLKQQGAKAGVSHLWQQSPGNGAVKYFTKAGGKLIKVHDDRWLDLTLYEGYRCTLCDTECHCQAAEMVLEF